MPTMLKGRSTPAAVAGKNGYSLISSAKFRELYAALLRCELLEERLGSIRTNDASGTQNLIAAAVGLTLELQREDTVVLTRQTFAANLVKGVPARVLLHYTDAGEARTTIAFDEVSALTSVSSAASAGLATGAALTSKIAKNRSIAVAFLEGGAATLKECREALELASKYKLPVLYVIQTGLDRGDEKLLAGLSELFPVITVDAQDLVAIYRVAQESIARARDGGPTLIVCVPYASEGSSASAIANMECYLIGKKLFENRWRDEALAAFSTELDAACLPQADPLA
jgi:TPP-dependent pyruvate/acetoin dehydrogenase alpha subunit